MANKMTRIQALEIAIASVENVEAKEILEKISASIAKHNASSSTRKTETPRQKENGELKARISEFLMEHAGEKYSLAQLKAEIEGLTGLSPQRLAPICNSIEGVQKAKENKVNVYFM